MIIVIHITLDLYFMQIRSHHLRISSLLLPQVLLSLPQAGLPDKVALRFVQTFE